MTNVLKDLRGDAGTIRSEYVIKGFDSGVTEHQRVADFILTHFPESPTPLRPMRGVTGYTPNNVNVHEPVKVVITDHRVMTMSGRLLGYDSTTPVFKTPADAALYGQHRLAMTFLEESRRLQEQRRALLSPVRESVPC